MYSWHHENENKTSIGPLSVPFATNTVTAIIIMLMRTVIAAPSARGLTIAKPNTAFDAGAYYIRTSLIKSLALRLEFA